MSPFSLPNFLIHYFLSVEFLSPNLSPRFLSLNSSSPLMPPKCLLINFLFHEFPFNNFSPSNLFLSDDNLTFIPHQDQWENYTDHVTWGPMRGLKKLHLMAQNHRTTEPHMYMVTLWLNRPSGADSVGEKTRQIDIQRKFKVICQWICTFDKTHTHLQHVFTTASPFTKKFRIGDTLNILTFFLTYFAYCLGYVC